MGAASWIYTAPGSCAGFSLWGHNLITSCGTQVLSLDVDAAGALNWISADFSSDSGGGITRPPVLDSAGNLYVSTSSKIRQLAV